MGFFSSSSMAKLEGEDGHAVLPLGSVGRDIPPVQPKGEILAMDADARRAMRPVAIRGIREGFSGPFREIFARLEKGAVDKLDGRGIAAQAP